VVSGYRNLLSGRASKAEWLADRIGHERLADLFCRSNLIALGRSATVAPTMLPARSLPSALHQSSVSFSAHLPLRLLRRISQIRGPLHTRMYLEAHVTKSTDRGRLCVYFVTVYMNSSSRARTDGLNLISILLGRRPRELQELLE
jgi:hypothetical protein